MQNDFLFFLPQNYTENIDFTQPLPGYNGFNETPLVYTACLIVRQFYETIPWKIFIFLDVGKSQTRKKLKPGSLPVLNMSKKMFQTVSIQESHRKGLQK